MCGEFFKRSDHQCPMNALNGIASFLQITKHLTKWLNEKMNLLADETKQTQQNRHFDDINEKNSKSAMYEIE